MLILDIKQKLETSIEDNELFIEVFMNEVKLHPNSYHKWKNYYKAKNEFDYALKLLDFINNLIQKDVKESIKK